MNRNRKYKIRRYRRVLSRLKWQLVNSMVDMGATHSSYRDLAEAYNRIATSIPGEPRIPVRYW